MRKSSSANILSKKPWLYEYIYPEARTQTVAACRNIIRRYLPNRSLHILDVGCGTGRVLARLVKDGHSGVGMDISMPMIDYARRSHPHLTIEYADMRSFDFGRQFDLIICVGSTFTYNLTNSEVHATLENFRKHLVEGGLLILDILNASRFLSSEVFQERVEMQVTQGDFHAVAVSRHLLDRRKQLLRRIRTWQIEGEKEPVVDNAEFRLFFPLELEDYISQHKFTVLGMWDNKDLIETNLTDRRLYISARAV